MINFDEKIKEVTKNILQAKVNLQDTTELKQRLDTYRLMKAKEIELKTAKNAKPMDDAAQVNMLRKMVKEREDTAKTYSDAGRSELADKELREATIIKELLPAEVSEETIEAYVAKEFPTITKKEMGFRIKCIKDVFPTADGAVVARLVKSHIKE
jgi:uncharacterized protein YqeY